MEPTEDDLPFQYGRVELEPMRCETWMTFFGSSMDLGLEPSAIFLSTQKSTNKKLQIQSTGDLPVFCETFNHCHCSTGGRSIWTASGRNGSTGAGVMWWKLGTKTSQNLPAFWCSFNAYRIYVYIYIYIHLCWFGMLMFFCVVMFSELFFSKFWRFWPLAFFLGGQSFSDSGKKHMRTMSHAFPKGPRCRSFYFVQSNNISWHCQSIWVFPKIGVPPNGPQIIHFN